MHRQRLIDLLEAYRPRYMDEAAFRQRALSYIHANPDCFNRELIPMHVTGSVWVVNPSYTRVLILHHKKLDQWFQPGGHADGESDIVRVSINELAEESGIDPKHFKIYENQIFDLDIHQISGVNYQVAHEHIDIRFLVELDDQLDVPGNDESHEVKWVPLEWAIRYNHNRSTYRMYDKTRVLRKSVNQFNAYFYYQSFGI